MRQLLNGSVMSKFVKHFSGLFFGRWWKNVKIKTLWKLQQKKRSKTLNLITHWVTLTNNHNNNIKKTSNMLSNNNRCITECRKFSPNIFNKNKCTLCFGKREEHNPAALDYNRVSSRLTHKSTNIISHLNVALSYKPCYFLNSTKGRSSKMFPTGNLNI